MVVRRTSLCVAALTLAVAGWLHAEPVASARALPTISTPEIADILRAFAGGDASALDVLERVGGPTKGVDVDRALWQLRRSHLLTSDGYVIRSFSISVGPSGLTGPSASVSLTVDPTPCLRLGPLANLVEANRPVQRWGPPTRTLAARLPSGGGLTVSAPDNEPPCVNHIVANGPRTDSRPVWIADDNATEQLAHALAEIAAGEGHGLDELRRWFAFDEAKLSDDRAPQQYLTTGTLRGAPAARFDMSLGPAGSHPLRTLRAYPWLGSSYPCIGVDRLKALWGWDIRPVPPAPPYHGAGPARKMHAGKLSGLEVSLGSREEAYHCVSSIFMQLPR